MCIVDEQDHIGLNYPYLACLNYPYLTSLPCTISTQREVERLQSDMAKATVGRESRSINTGGRAMPSSSPDATGRDEDEDAESCDYEVEDDDIEGFGEEEG